VTSKPLRAILAALMLVSAPARAASSPEPPPPASQSGPRQGHGDSYFSYCLSRQAWFRQDYAEALEQMLKAVKADPDSAELAMELAQLHLDLGQPAEAARQADRALRIAPADASSWRILADAYFMESMKENATTEVQDKALEAYRKVIELDPADAEALLNQSKLLAGRGDLKGALDSLQRLLSVSPRSDEGVFLSAQLLLKMNRGDEAVKLLEMAVQANPASAQLGIALLEAYEAKGDLEAAMAMGQRLPRLHVDPIRVQFILARLSQKRGKPGETFDHLQQMSNLMDQKPLEFSEADRAEVRLRMVLALIEAGRTQDALTVADHGIKTFPADPRFLLRKGEALLVAGRDADADRLFKEGLAKAGAKHADQEGLARQISDTCMAAGARLERAGSLEAAERHLRKSIEWNGRNAPALNYLGYMLADRGVRLDEAVGYIRQALREDPSNGAYLDSLGWALYKKRQYAEAEAALDQALATMDEEAAIHDHIGDLYQATGRMKEAVRAWGMALERHAENPDAIRAKIERAGGAPATAP